MSFLSTFDHTNSMTDNIIDRDQLQEDMINRIIDGMDVDSLCQLAYDYLNENYDKYTVDELITEVEEFYPDMLEESNTNWVSRGCASRTTYTQNRHRGQNGVL